MKDRRKCIRLCRKYGLLATQMVFPTPNYHYREQALDRAVDGVTWCYPLNVGKRELASGTVAFFEKLHLQLCERLVLPIYGAKVLESQGECPWQTPSTICKSGASIP